MEAKCYNCKHVWDYELENIKIEREQDDMGYDYIVFKLYCPRCSTASKRMDICNLIREVTPDYIDSHNDSPNKKYSWD